MSNTSLSLKTRASATAGKQVGSYTISLGPDARLIVEVRAATVEAAAERAAALAQRFTAATSTVASLIPPQVAAGLKLARVVARAAGAGRLRSLYSRLPSRWRSRAAAVARELGAA